MGSGLAIQQVAHEPQYCRNAGSDPIAAIMDVAKRFNRTSAAISMLVSQLHKRGAKSSQ